MILKKVKEEIHVLVSFKYMERVGYKNGGGWRILTMLKGGSNNFGGSFLEWHLGIPIL